MTDTYVSQSTIFFFTKPVSDQASVLLLWLQKDLFYSLSFELQNIQISSTCQKKQTKKHHIHKTPKKMLFKFLKLIFVFSILCFASQNFRDRVHIYFTLCKMLRSHKPSIKLHCINLETNLEFEQFRSLIFCNTRGQQHFKFFNCLFIEHFCIGEQKKIYLYKINVYRKINEDLKGRKIPELRFKGQMEL